MHACKCYTLRGSIKAGTKVSSCLFLDSLLVVMIVVCYCVCVCDDGIVVLDAKIMPLCS